MCGVRGVRAEAVVDGGDGGEVVGFVEEEGQGGEEGEGGYEGVPEGAAVDVAVAGRGGGWLVRVVFGLWGVEGRGRKGRGILHEVVGGGEGGLGGGVDVEGVEGGF